MRGLAIVQLSLLALSPTTVRGQDTAQVVAQWVRSHATPLTSDLAPIGSMIGEAPLVGLGEGTHGTREFYLLKGRLVESAVAP